MDVDPVGDQFTGHRQGQGRPHQPRLPVMEGAHGVVQVGDVAGTGGHGTGSLFPGGVAVPQGNDDPGPAAAGNEIHVLQGLRGQGQEPDQAGKGFHQLPAGFPDVAGFLGALVFFADEGAFQVGPQDLCPGNPAPGLPDGGKSLGNSGFTGGHGGGEPAGDPGGGQQPAHGFQGFPAAVHGIPASAAVDVKVEESR